MSPDAHVTDASVDAPTVDVGLVDARAHDASAADDVTVDTSPEPPRTGPCEPRRAPIVCNPRRIVDDCASFGEECTRASGACIARQPEGALCRSADQCQEGLVCTGTISYGICAPTPGEGEACTTTCLESDRLFCDLDGAPPVCVPKRSAGGSCAGSANACELGLFCNAEMICAAPGAAGAHCASPYECATGLACADGTCAAAPGLGDECSDVCADGLFCNAADFPYVCAARRPAGASCVGFSPFDAALECGDGLRCIFDAAFTGGLCIAPVPVGGVCDLERDACANGLRCEESVCVALAVPVGSVLGAPCDDAGCEASAYCAGVPSEAGICWSVTCEG